MKYKIVITALDPNPQFEAELADHKRREGSRYEPATPYPQRELEVKKLETVITEDEFKACRDAILKSL